MFPGGVIFIRNLWHSLHQVKMQKALLAFDFEETKPGAIHMHVQPLCLTSFLCHWYRLLGLTADSCDVSPAVK